MPEEGAPGSGPNCHRPLVFSKMEGELQTTLKQTSKCDCRKHFLGSHYDRFHLGFAFLKDTCLWHSTAVEYVKANPDALF